MSAGAVYIMANNDGQMDELLYMSGLLNKRIGDIMQKRMAQYQQMSASGMDVTNFSVNPTIADIEGSHSLLVSRSYRPYVMIAFEYLINKMSSGNSGWGQEVIFQPRTFGEFMSDTMLSVELKPFNFTDVSLQSALLATATGTNNTALPWNVNSTVAATTAAGTYTTTNNYITDMSGNVLVDRALIGNTDASSAYNTAYPSTIYVRNYIQYAAFPMHRLIKKVSFSVNSTPIDEYTTETDSFFLLFQLKPNLKASYYKCIGQELPISGYTTSLITDGAFPLSNGVPPHAFTTAPVTSQSPAPTARKQVATVSGFQTPQYVQPDFLGFYPNKFDHCNGIRNAIPVLAMPNAERLFTYQLCEITDLLYAYCPLFTETTTTTWQYVSVANDPHIVQIGSQTSRTQLPATFLSADSSLNGSSIANFQMQMYINNVFVDPSIHDIYLERIGFSLTRVHRSQALQMNTSSLETNVTQFKWPIEFFFVGLRPQSNSAAGSPIAQRNWWNFSYIQSQIGQTYANTRSWQVLAPGTTLSNGTQVPYVGPAYTTTGAGTIAAGTSAFLQSSQTPVEQISWDHSTPSISKLQVSLQTIVLYNTYDSKFYNAYLPYIFGSYNLAGTEDNSALFCTFCFTPGDNGSPTGHVNTSRSREFTISLTSNVVGSGNANNTPETNGVVYCVGTSINFWLISSGNLFLRFS